MTATDDMWKTIVFYNPRWIDMQKAALLRQGYTEDQIEIVEERGHMQAVVKRDVVIF